MPDEQQVAQAVREAIDCFGHRDYAGHALHEAKQDGLCGTESGFTITLPDGAVFLVMVTQLQEAE